MIPKLIQRQGAQHIAEQASAQAPLQAPLVRALNPPPAVLELIPASVARENLVLPLRLEGRVLHVAVADASNLMLRDKLSFIVNRDIRLVEYPRADILRAVRRLYPETGDEAIAALTAELAPATEGSKHEEYPAGIFEKARLGFGDAEAEKEPRAGVVRRALGRSRAKGRDNSIDLDDLCELPAGDPYRMLQPGEDGTPDYGTETMWYYTVEEGQRTLMIRHDGRMDVIVGPRRVWQGLERVRADAALRRPPRRLPHRPLPRRPAGAPRRPGRGLVRPARPPGDHAARRRCRSPPRRRWSSTASKDGDQHRPAPDRVRPDAVHAPARRVAAHLRLARLRGRLAGRAEGRPTAWSSRSSG